MIHSPSGLTPRCHDSPTERVPDLRSPKGLECALSDIQSWAVREGLAERGQLIVCLHGWDSGMKTDGQLSRERSDDTDRGGERGREGENGKRRGTQIMRDACRENRFWKAHEECPLLKVVSIA